MLDNYIIKNSIGCGSFGDVCIAYDKVNKKDVAIKKIILHDMKESNLLMIINEVKIGYFNNCDFLAKILDFFINQKTVYVVMPLYNNIDYKAFAKKNKITEAKKIEIIFRILQGMQYLHINKVIHRDLKITNIMLDNDNAFIGDFGTCNILPENKYFTSTCIGTPYYLSPEIIEGNKYNTKIDIYSLGCMICEIIYDKVPYVGDNIYMLYKNVLNGKKNVNISNNFLGNLINDMIKKNSYDRPVINDIILLFSKKYNIKYKQFRKDENFYKDIRIDFGKVKSLNDLKITFDKIKRYKLDNYNIITHQSNIKNKM